MTKNVHVKLSEYSLDAEVMKKCIDLQRLEIAKYVLQNCGIRPDAKIQVIFQRRHKDIVLE